MALLLLLSALCNTLPFYLPSTAPLIFGYPLFLLSAIQSPKITKQSLALWAVTISIFEWLAVADALIYLAPSNQTLLALIPGTLLIGYTAFYSFIWAWATHRLLSWSTHTYQFAIWTVSFWLYLIFKDQAQFFIFGRLEGYPFANPILPLCYYPHLFSPLCRLPEWLGLAWFSLFSALVKLFSVKPSIKTVVVALATLIPWLQTPYAQKAAPPWLSAIGHLPIMIPDTSPEMAAALVAHEIQILKKQFNTLTTIILPESAWNGTRLTARDSIALFQHCPVENILIGSFSENATCCYNSAYQFDRGTIASITHKRHALPLAERAIPLPLCSHLYFEKSSPIAACPAPKQLIHLKNPDLSAVVYICSELFFNMTPDDPYDELIIALINDWWFRMPHFRTLMMLAARLRSMQWQRPVLYISYNYALYCEPNGDFYSLITCSCFDKTKKEINL